MAGIDARARYVVFFPFDEFWESIDLAYVVRWMTLYEPGSRRAGRSRR
jgi:hypothetical protein